jgi:hypothetical protein
MKYNLDMKKPSAILLAFLFSLTVFLAGASGYFDCAAECAYKMATVHSHSAMGFAKLTAPKCCSGAIKNTCEMGRTVVIKIPECSTACHASVYPKPISIGFLSNDSGANRFRPTPFNLRISANEKRPKRPTYLETLSILC